MAHSIDRHIEVLSSEANERDRGAGSAAPLTGRPLRILVLSWNFPTLADPLRGLWVERMADAASAAADVRVIVPIPWVPPWLPLRILSRFRSVPTQERRGRVEIHYPRVPGSIGHVTAGIDARLARPAVLACARRLHDEAPFDLIHAHFIYPEGVVASTVGRALGVPVMTSEHALWTPWLADQARVGHQVHAALPGIRLVAAVSSFQRSNIDTFVGGRITTGVLPNVVDDVVFRPSSRARDPHELLFVGLLRRVKRVDILLRALAEARRTIPELRLRILSSNAFRSYGRDNREIRELIHELGLESAVRIVPGADPQAVAEAMRSCAFVVVSSTRRETFCSVAAEALACGTPLVITRCGGPEEFVTADDGVMVEPDDSAAFAAGILRAMSERSRFDGVAMSQRIVRRFGRDAWRERAIATYESLLPSPAR